MPILDIPIAKIGRPEWVLPREKFIRYKVGVRNNFNPKAKKFTRRPIYMFLDDRGDTLGMYLFRCEGGMKDRQSVKKRIIISNRRGKLNVYRIRSDRTGSSIRNVNNSLFTESLAMGKWYETKAVKVRIGKVFKNFFEHNKLPYDKKQPWQNNVFNTMYPALKDAKCQFVPHLSGVYSRYFRNPSIKYVIKQCFGNSGKVITQKVSDYYEKEKQFDILKLGVLLKGLLSFDEIIKVIDSAPIKPYTGPIWVKDFRSLMRNYSSKRILSIVMRGDTGYIVSDTIGMWRQHKTRLILPEKPKSFSELHDNFSQQIYKLKSVDFDLYIREDYKRIDGTVIEDMTIVVPKTAHQLIDWGRTLSNCMGSYSERVNEKRVCLLGILKGGELTYAISIENKCITQFKAKFNDEALDEDKVKVERFLEGNAIIVKRCSPSLGEAPLPF
jgi:hypothetical protein